MAGWDRARHHRVNACGQEHGPQRWVERLKSQRRERQGREVDLRLGHMMRGFLWFQAGGQQCVDV